MQKIIANIFREIDEEINNYTYPNGWIYCNKKDEPIIILDYERLKKRIELIKKNWSNIINRTEKLIDQKDIKKIYSAFDDVLIEDIIKLTKDREELELKLGEGLVSSVRDVLDE